MVERLSARGHLVSGESEGHEGPLESDNTTRLSCGMEKTSRKPGMHPRNPILLKSGTWGWRLEMRKLSSEMDLGVLKHVGYEVWLKFVRVGCRSLENG
ncbi:hypothetical protein CDL15_Pgr003925 [Punica granatum]|uniref:Uncharacterized protein n=1 Tax=Punica granatum TaxID=22663 RepID=A0A218W8X8_PUNGR|nr:hypothetical protein CDL15_Pgr003925 [Punica granatum]